VENRRAEQVLDQVGRVTSGRQNYVGIGYGRMNVGQIFCEHVCKWELIPIETVPGVREGEVKEEW
jgi:hypothetical protein